MPPPAAHLVVGNLMSEPVNFPPELYQATASLIENLLASEAFLTYRSSANNLNANPQARALLERLSTVQTEIRHKQSNNNITPADLDELRAVQAQVQANMVIMTYAQSQQAAISFLREINQEISQLLGVNFASLARQSTC